MTKSALLIDHYWAMKIMREGKTWEIRSRQCNKRGRIVIASTAKSSPTGRSMQVGEATVAGCKVVARKRDGFMSAPVESPMDFLFLKEHIPKHQIKNVQDFPHLLTYQTAYAWILSDVTEFDVPRDLCTKPGCVVWAKV